MLLDLWDKAVPTEGYERRQWEEFQGGVAELADKGLGLPEYGGAEEPTPSVLPPFFVQVVESSTDGVGWKEVLRSPLGHVLECDDVCRNGDKFFRIYVSEGRRGAAAKMPNGGR